MALFEFPASYAQRRMWLLDRLDPGQANYVIGWAIWLDGPLDEAALARAWDAALQRHEALRTTVRDDAGEPVQVIDEDTAAARLRVEDADPQTARDRIRALAATPFDLAAGPLARAVLLRLGARRHVLAVVVHHIVADGWTLRQLFQELVADYAADGAVTPEPPLQYADFTQWQFEHADAGGFADDERFWTAELAGAPAELTLPVERPYPARQRFAADEVAFTVDEQTADRLRSLARERSGTLFAVVAAAYATVLARLGAAEELLIGVPVSARTRAETETVAGLFVNTVAVRVDLRGDPGLATLVDRVHTATTRALAHQEVPFARVVELCRPERSHTRLPLVQVLCAVEDPWPATATGGLCWQPELIPNGTGKFELELTVTDGPGVLTGRLNYLTDLFGPDGARRIADAIRLTLEQLARDSAVRVSDVDLLTPATRDLVTVAWPAGTRPAPADTTATELLAPACTGDLRDTVERIAAALRERGSAVQDTVAILLPRSAWALAALLGVWWTGGAYLPLDPAAPVERLRGMLTDAGVRTLITHRDLLTSDLEAEHVLDLADLADFAGRTEPVAVPPTAAAYELFTSGTTGRPKAVTVTQGAVGALLLALRDLLPIRPGDRMAILATLAFDISVVEQLMPMLTGATRVVVPDDIAVDGQLLRRMLEADEVTVVQATPTTWRMLAAAGGVPDTVRVRVTGGEAIARDLATALMEGPEVALCNLYGPTETTVYCTGAVVTDRTGPLDVGVAFPGSRAYVLDEQLRPVPPMVTGEIYLGGACLARGYRGAPGLTAEKFLPDPFTPGERLYRSGDLGRWRPDGRLEILGRADRQLKVRGFRVESAEIEAVLRRHPGVVDALVTASGGPSGDLRLAAYLVVRDGAGDPPDGLLEHLHRFLPGYMIPAAFVTVPELPRTERGKVDPSSLPEPQWGAAGRAEGPGRAAETPVERELTAMVGELLGLSGPVGVDDNFFVLGGHSFTAAQLMARLRARYGVELPVRALFDNPTMAALAKAVEVPTGDDFLDVLTDADVEELLR
ncbi:amino acid adenylation domain-containing protein [Krasilnikovia cinnamomea]|uniref:Amino acid adenylation domain-containing protein n=1 Tax=Krasilnikovia cinnamomea TaxID=349313 RepID=A0A4V2G7P1_9ACTN|nr:non-ribosomal peptide synthetase [Krasilnikovia cinnamomea]RZU53336.1 amino acid adenylation domain-containing protein [Krasilnikovia cinnamomea]